MIYIHTALHAEAKAVISNLNLKKNHNSYPFEIFHNDNIALIISGTGMIRASAAISHLLTSFASKNDDIAVNIGICGSTVENVKIGDCILANKIKNYSTGRYYFTDMLVNHPFTEASLETFPHVVTSSELIECDYVDMEAAGFFEAASLYLPSHRVFCFKTVSDHLDTDILNKQFVTTLVANIVPPVMDYIYCVNDSLLEPMDILTDEDHENIVNFCKTYKFTVSMCNLLKKHLRYYKLKCGSLLLLQYDNYPLPANKTESISMFNEIISRMETTKSGG